MSATLDFDAVAHAAMLLTKPRYGWIPAGAYNYTPTPCKRLRGFMGDDLVSVVQRRKGKGYEYAVVFIGARGLVSGESGRSFKAVGDPMLDTFAVENVADWTTRSRVALTLSAF